MPCGLNETRQLRRLDACCASAHVQFHPVGEHEAHPGAALWEGRCAPCAHTVAPKCRRDAHWHLWHPIEPRRDLGQRHAGFLQRADVDESFQVRRGVVRSAPRPERRGQQPALDVVTHGAARHPSQLCQLFDPIAALVLVVLAHR